MSSELLCLITVIVDKHIVLSLKTYSLTEYWDIGSYLALLIYNYYAKLSFDCLLTTSVCCYDRKKITLLFKPPLIRLQKPQFKHYFRVPALLVTEKLIKKREALSLKTCFQIYFCRLLCCTLKSICGNFITNIFPTILK